MSSAANHHTRSAAGASLTRRLIGSYLMFGLACVLFCVGSALWLSWHETMMRRTEMLVVLPLLMLLWGAVVLKRSVGLNAAIEDQLRRAAAIDDAQHALSPLPVEEAAAEGWNAIVKRLNDSRTVSALERRLTDSLGSVERERWEAIFNGLGDGIAVCDAQGLVLQANKAFAALLNLSASSEALRTNLIDRLTAITAPESAAGLRTIAAGNVPASRDVLRGADVASGVLRATRTPLLGQAFAERSSLWTIRDVTQQKLAEQMRNQFVSTATHELRTPLTNIRAYAELLADGDVTDLQKQKELCNVINAEASRLARFVDQMLNISHMESGGLRLNRHETDMERLVGEVAANVQPQAVTKGLAFDVRLPPKVPKLSVDKDKLAAALVNLLGNAVKYTAEGGVKLTVEVGSDQIAFHVDDTGFGIGPAELSRLGEKFFRSDDPRVQDVNGSGLGLAFSQEVARLHGGKVTATSELNKGSRFTLQLPLS